MPTMALPLIERMTGLITGAAGVGEASVGEGPASWDGALLAIADGDAPAQAIGEDDASDVALGRLPVGDGDAALHAPTASATTALTVSHAYRWVVPPRPTTRPAYSWHCGLTTPHYLPVRCGGMGRHRISHASILDLEPLSEPLSRPSQASHRGQIRPPEPTWVVWITTPRIR